MDVNGWTHPFNMKNTQDTYKTQKNRDFGCLEPNYRVI